MAETVSEQNASTPLVSVIVPGSSYDRTTSNPSNMPAISAGISPAPASIMNGNTARQHHSVGNNDRRTSASISSGPYS